MFKFISYRFKLKGFFKGNKRYGLCISGRSIQVATKAGFTVFEFNLVEVSASRSRVFLLVL